jgi:2-polyprenyl-3-methyl-5-hydroxy-6-metoxy-1,4-benzoquinol methylase
VFPKTGITVMLPDPTMKEPTKPLDCPLCSGKNVVHLFVKQDIPYYKCRDCSFIFSRAENNPNLTNAIEDYEPAYMDYFSEKPHDKRNHEWIIKILAKHKALRASRILDIGCGSGKFVQYLEEKGYEVFGLEPSKALFDTFLHADHFFNLTASQYLKQSPSDKFDIIIISDVLEHVDDPLSFLRDVRSMMSPDGILFISTPDTGSSFARIAGKNWHYYNKYHLSLFSRSNLANAVRGIGLTPRSFGHVTRFQSMDYIIKYLFNFILHKKGAAPGFLGRLHLPVNLFDNMYIVFGNAEDQKSD